MDEKQTILIVDDKKANLVALRQTLSDVDAQIVEATSGNQALATTLDHNFSLAILDVQMPGMDGYELVELLRGDPKTAHLPVIFMTATFGEELYVFKGYEVGAVDYIIKPYKPAVLLAKVRVFLDLQRTQKELTRRVLDLSASEERYRTLVTMIPDIVYRIDTEGRFTFLNDAVASLGYGSEELIGLPFTEIMLPADVEHVSRRLVLPEFTGKSTGNEGAPKLFDERRTGPRQTMMMEVHLVSRQTGRVVQGELHSGARPMSTAEVNSSGLYGKIEGRPPTFLGTVGVIRDISQRKTAEDELSRYRQQLEKMVQEQTIELEKRVSEVSCLYAISSLLAEPSKSIDEALKSAADLMPTGWRHPEAARARIVFEGREFTSEGFRETPWMQRADIVLSQKIAGTVEVCYLEETPALDEGPFLKQEQNLIDELARQLAVRIQRERSNARLEHVNRVLRSLRDVNKLIVREKRPKPLIQAVCDNLTHTRGLQGAWIVLTDGLSDRVEGAHAGFNDIAISELLNLFQQKELPACFGHGQTESGVKVMVDPAAECANCPLEDINRESGAITIELKYGNRRYGFMGIAVPMEFAGDEQEVSLFKEIAGDIAFALASMEQEEALHKSQLLLDARARIAGAFLAAVDEDIFAEILDVILSIMQSEFGVFGYIDEKGDLLVPSMTRHIWDECQIPAKDIRFPHDTWGDSPWCRAIREKRIIHANHPPTKVPVGHVPIKRNLAAPIIFQDEVIGLLHVANKKTDYDADDIHILETISDVIAPILNTRLQRDQQEHKRAEAEAQYRAIFEGTAEGILVTDMETREFRYCNPAICDMLGYTQEELMGLGVTDIHPKASLNRDLAALEAQARGDKRLAPSLPHLRKDGGVAYADVQATSTVINGRRCNVEFFTDVTQRRQLEEQLRQAQKMESLGTLAGGIAHDFNNILSAIMGNAELAMMDQSTGSEDLAGNLKGIYQAGIRASELVRQILTFSRRTDAQLKPLQIDIVIREALKLLRSTLPTSIDIRHRIAKGLDPVLADPTQIHQIIMNLCTNAGHAMETNGGILEVTLEPVVLGSDENPLVDHLKPGPYLKLTVSDTGCGMTPDIITSIFDPYFTTKDLGEGTGLGLAVVLGIIKDYGGDIFVDSTPGKGSIFTIYFPTVKSASADKEKSDLELLTRGTEHILVIDDEPPILAVIGGILKQHGYQVITESDSQQALERFKRDPGAFDLVISDVAMPKLTGDRLAAKILAIRPEIPVVLCTGYSRSISEQSIKPMGIRTLMTKPIARSTLLTEIRKILDDITKSTVACSR